MSEIPLPFAVIYKYASYDAAMNIIKSQSLKFSNPIVFNDVFDCTLYNIYFDLADTGYHAKEDIKTLLREFPTLKDNLHLMPGAFEHAAELRIKNCAATCFSLDGKNELMWGVYGDGHNGVCLSFDNAIEERFINNPGIEGEMKYNQTDQVNYCADRIKALGRIFLSKNLPWQHEQEYRFVTLKGPGYYKFNLEFLKAIYLGLKVSRSKVEILKSVSMDMGFQHLKFYQAVIVDKQIQYVDCNL